MCGKLQKAMYSTRDAAQNGQRKCSEIVRNLGFITAKLSPCHFFHKGWQVCGRVHGSDFVFVGKSEFLQVKS